MLRFLALGLSMEKLLALSSFSSLLFQALDVGGSIFVHTFGAYFGLAVARVLYQKAQTTSEKEESVYHSDLFSMIGIIAIYIFLKGWTILPKISGVENKTKMRNN